MSPLQDPPTALAVMAVGIFLNCRHTLCLSRGILVLMLKGMLFSYLYIPNSYDKTDTEQTANASLVFPLVGTICLIHPCLHALLASLRDIQKASFNGTLAGGKQAGCYTPLAAREPKQLTLEQAQHNMQNWQL